jgi:hypothetical protein
MTKTPGEKALYRWTRDLHLCLGLFVSPFVIAFAASVFFLNHAKVDPAVATSVVTIRDVTIPAGLDVARGREAADRARQLVNQAGLTGEIGFVRYVRSEQRVVIPVSRPGLEATATSTWHAGGGFQGPTECWNQCPAQDAWSAQRRSAGNWF